MAVDGFDGGPFLAGGKAGPAAAAEVRPRNLFDHPSPVAAGEDFGQRPKTAVAEILLDTRRIDHAVVPQSDAVLPVEKGHVAVKIEIFPADRLVAHPQPFDDPAFQHVLIDDFLQVRDALHAVEHLVGPDQNVGASPHRLLAACAEAGGRGQAELFRAQPAGREPLGG